MTATGPTQGILHLPGSTPETKRLVENLLAEDRETHHCFYGKIGFHNHLPHHLLAAYDLGAPARVLQAIYDDEAGHLSPLNLVDRKENIVAPPDITVTRENWTDYVGTEKNYAAYLKFFKAEVQRTGVSECLDEYVFSPRANGNETNMLLRFAGGAVHPLIQVSHGVEFNEPSLVASGLAQTAVSRAHPSSTYDDNMGGSTTESTDGPPLLSVIKQMYDSEILVPIMPYQPDALLSTRLKDAMTAGRPEEIRRLSALWVPHNDLSLAALNAKMDELVWAATLLTFATGKHGRRPRLDFFLMHLLTSSLFLPSLVAAIKTPENKARLLRLYLSVVLMVVLLRGRPRIDPTLMETYTAFPRPPILESAVPTPDTSALGDPRNAEHANPWPAVLAAVIYAPDAHTVKALRTLYYGAARFGETPAGAMPGALDEHGRETLVGAAALDGTVFVRAAGVLMDTLGWVSHGQKEGSWDRSALGWDEAWDAPDN